MWRFLFSLSLFLCLATTAVAAEKVVLISGATKGIGLATAKAFQQQGWKVWAGYREQIPSELNALENVRFVKLDVTNADDVASAVNALLEQDKRLDALINCAGYGLIGAEECIGIEEMQKQLDVNFLGAMRLIHAVLPHMREQHAGHIINISSTSGVRAVPGLGLYAASKFALEGMSESLAVTVSPWNIKVSIIEPGTVNNQWVQNCVLAEAHQDIEPYRQLQESLFTKLSQLASAGQECEAIGTLIVSVAECENPHMRYQTSAKVIETVAKKLVDPTGDAMRDEQLKFFRSLVVP